MTFNIQKLRTLNKLSTFLTSVMRRQPHIIALTELDLPSKDTGIFINLISRTLNSKGFKHNLKTIHQRSLIIYKNELDCEPIDVGAMMPVANRPSARCLDAVRVKFLDREITIVSTYSLTRTTKCPITGIQLSKARHIDNLVAVLKKFKRKTGELIVTGDFNTKPLEHLSPSSVDYHFLRDLKALDLTDAYFVGSNAKTQQHTNVSGHSNNRLDRFYLSPLLFEITRIKYTVLQKLPFSTHFPVQISLTDRTMERVEFPKEQYTPRRRQIPQPFREQPALRNYIFAAPEEHASFDWYIKSINDRADSLRRVFKHMPKDHPWHESRLPLYNTPTDQLRTPNARFKKPKLNQSFTHESIVESAAFYSELFAAKPEEKNSPYYSSQFLEEMGSEDKVTPEEKEALSKPPTLDELHGCLTTLHAKGYSAPGEDGLLYADWYMAWETAKIPLLNLTTKIIAGNIKASKSNFLNVLIKQIPKKAMDPDQFNIHHIRPISLTTTALRLANYVITMRMMPVLNRIISPAQQAFLTDRNIHLNIQTTRLIASHLHNTAAPSRQHIFMVDFSKAFDCLHHFYLRKLLVHLNFPGSLIESIIQQCSLSTAKVLNGPFIYKDSIPLRRGVRQGLPFSPLLFNLAVEPLLRQLNSHLTGIIYQQPQQLTPRSSPGTPLAIKCLAFADDLVVFNHDEIDFEHTKQSLDHFAECSHLTINVDKSKAYCSTPSLQRLPRTLDSITVNPIADNPIYLGVPLLEIDWPSKLEAAIKRVQFMPIKDLNLYERVQFVNTFVYSTLYFFDQHSPIPWDIVDHFDENIKYLLTNRLPHMTPANRIQWHTLHHQGGMGLKNLKYQLLGRRAYYIYLTLGSTTHHFLKNHPGILLLRAYAQLLSNAWYRNTHGYRMVLNQLAYQVEQDPSCIPTSSDVVLPGKFYHDKIVTIPFHYLYELTNQDLYIQLQGTGILEKFSIATSKFSTAAPAPAPGPIRRGTEEEKLTFDFDALKLYIPFQSYLLAWQALRFSPESPHIMKPLILSNIELQKVLALEYLSPSKWFEDAEHSVEVSLTSFKYINAKRSLSETALAAATEYWTASRGIPATTFKPIIKQLAKLHHQHPKLYNEVFELQVGMLNQAFFFPCPFCNERGGARHVLFECDFVLRLHALCKFTTIQPQHMVGHPHNKDTWQDINMFLRFVMYAARYFHRTEILPSPDTQLGNLLQMFNHTLLRKSR